MIQEFPLINKVSLKQWCRQEAGSNCGTDIENTPQLHGSRGYEIRPSGFG